MTSAKIRVSRRNRIGQRDEAAVAQFGTDCLPFRVAESLFGVEFLVGDDRIIDGKAGGIK